MIGTKLRAYEITEQIGSGGMATVYRAYQPSMDRHVAVKVIRSQVIDDPGLRERFQREARLIAKLEHPHLLPVFDFDLDSNPPFIVMRYLDGGTLKQIQERGGVPPEELLLTLRQVAGALDYAHRQGVVHRDLKPSNVMIDLEGNAFLADFGIARSSDGKTELTGTGSAIGTPAYMSPEQARGEASIGSSADIYSLGAMVFELLTGHLPFERESSLAVIMAHVNDPVPKPTDLAPHLPPAVDAVLARALAKDKAKRHPTAGALVDDLARALAVQPSHAPSQLQTLTETISVDRAALAVAQRDADTPSDSTPPDQQRQMTAVHVDVTELAEILYESGADAERARNVMDALWKSFARIVEERNGVVQTRAEEIGVALWGRERAREDDPEMAIRAALRMKEAARQETRRVLGEDWEPTEESPLPFTVGITTGAVLLERDTQSGTYSATGATMTLAGRLKDAAPPGEIIVSHDTYTHVRGIFSFLPQTPLRVRGRKEPLEIYLLTAVKPRAFRMKARGIEGVETRMIGREIELRLLQEALTLTLEDGETQVVTVVGEAGVGKSRLLFEFSNWTDLQEQTMWFFEARATQPSMLQPYSLTRDLFSFRFQILDSDPLSVVREKFVEGVAGFLGEGTEREAHYIGQLVGFDFSDRPDVAAALKDGDAFRQKAQEYLGKLFTTACEEHPVVIHIEDIHWADDRSLDLINNLVREHTDLPLFVLCMARPGLYERRPQWGEGQRFHERIQLEPLSQLSSRRLVKELLKKVPSVPPALRDLVVDRADGNPFYIEELIKALIDDRVILKGEDEWSVDESRLSSVRVPTTLTGVLQSRLDTLPTGLYQLLQRVSVIGRIFWDAAAVHLGQDMGITSDDARRMLEELREREMILRREESGFAGTQEYVFRHAILRDVTYDTVVPRQRRALHKLAAEWLVEVGGERAGEHTLLVAEHYGRADEPVLAAEQLTVAGERAMRLATFGEAATLLQRAREVLSEDEHREQILGIEIARGRLESVRSTYAKAREILAPALEEARALGHKVYQAKILGYLARIAMWQDDMDSMVRYLDEALPITREVGDVPALILVLRMLANSKPPEESEEAQRLLKESIELARQIGDRHSEASAYNSLGNHAQRRSDARPAIELYDKARGIYEELGDRQGVAMVQGNASNVWMRLGEYERAEREGREALRVCLEIGDRSFAASGWANLAELLLQMGRVDEALQAIKDSVKLAREVGAGMNGYPAIFGLIDVRKGNRERALSWIGFSRANPGSQQAAMEELMVENDELLRGDMTDEAFEQALQAGAGRTLEDVFEEIERVYP